MRRVVVTGLGAITPLGVGVEATWSRLITGHCGIVNLHSCLPQGRWEGLTSTVAGLVPTTDRDEKHGWRPSKYLRSYERRSYPQFTQYAIAAADMALQQSGWKPMSKKEREATGVCIGSGVGNIKTMHRTSLDYDSDGYRKVSPLFVPQILINMGAALVSIRNDFRGPNHSVATACTTGAHSIGDAARFIAFGDADVMVAGGTESCIHPLTFAGFGRARSLATAFNDNPTAASRPFDKWRNGFVIAEGAAVVVLEELQHAKSRRANILAELKGYGCSGDAFHITSPREDGTGALLAMKMALKNAGLKPRDVDYINAHATGTQMGDAVEARAIASLMLGEDGVATEQHVTVSSTKGAVGHLLGAAGAIEAIFSILAIINDVVPPTINLENPQVQKSFNFVAEKAQQRRVSVALSNSFGFGGTNASLVFSKVM